MAALDSRSRSILLILLYADEPLPMAAIAERLQISPRAVGYSLHRIEFWLNVRKISLVKQPGKGVYLNCPAKERKKLISEIEVIKSYDLILSKEERVRLLIIALLTAKESLLVKSFAPRLGVSRPTLFNDLDDVERWLNGHDLLLIRRPGFGFKVEGSELKTRNALEEIVLDSAGQMSLLAYIQGNTADSTFSLEKFSLGMEQISRICEVSFDFVEPEFLAEKVEKLSSIQFTDSSHVALVLFFSILLERVQTRNFLTEFPYPTPNLLETKEHWTAQEIARIIKEREQLDLNQEEVANIAAHLMCIKGLQSLDNYDVNATSVMNDADIEQILDEMIHEAAGLLHPILNVDQQLRQGLRYHIRPAINRLYFGRPIQNNLLPEIKSQYTYVYGVAEKAGKILQEWLGIQVPEAEIGYLAMHFGAALERQRSLLTNRIKTIIVCGGGCSTAWMLISRLAAEFPELDVINIKSAKDFSSKEFRPEAADLIITTIPLQHPGIPLIQVTPLLSATDKQQIRQILGMEVLRPQAAEKLGHSVGPSILELLTADTLQFGRSASDWESAVEVCCTPLLRNDSITGQYVEAIKNLIRQHGPYMVLSPGIVLLHAMTGFGVNKVCMSLTTFQTPVKFGHTYNDPVFLGFVIGSPDDHSHLPSLRQLSKLLEDKTLMQSFRLPTSEQELGMVVERALLGKFPKEEAAIH